MEVNSDDRLGQEDTLARLLEGADNTNFTKRREQNNPKKESDSKLTEMISSKPSEISTQDSSISVTQDVTSDIPQIFQHMKFLVIGFDEQEHQLLKEQIESFSGELVPRNFEGIADYLVVPVFNDKEIHFTTTEVVNNLFIHECERDEELVTDIAYYHRPYNLPKTKPLPNCVITLSGYSGYERAFLRLMIQSLGGTVQEQLARETSVAKGVTTASTHLLTYEGTGKEYEAALKWGLPVIGKEWLMECYKTGKYIPENEFLIGSSKGVSPPWNFSWVVENQLAAMSCPNSESNLKYLWQIGIRHLVTLSPDKMPAIAAPDMKKTLIAVEEFEPPSLEDMVQFIDICEKCLTKKQAVGVHCRMGRGRTAVMAACYLVRFRDFHPQSAIGQLRQQRPGSVETFEQERAVFRYHDYLRGTCC